MIVASLVSYLLSSLLVVVGLVWGGSSLRRTEKTVTAEQDTANKIYLQAGAEGHSDEWKRDQLAKAEVRRAAG